MASGREGVEGDCAILEGRKDLPLSTVEGGGERG